MNPTVAAICFALALSSLCLLVTNASRPSQNVTEDMHLINKSLEDLLAELAIIKRDAAARMVSVKNRISLNDGSNEQAERIRLTKVSRFILKRVAELESESIGMRESMAKLAKLDQQARQEDHDFDELSTASSSSTTRQPSSSTSQTNSQEGMPASSTQKPAGEDEAAKIGFDLEALKKLGEEIGKRVDQFGKDAAKNLAELIEGIKLVFKEPKTTSAPSTTQ